MVQRKSRAGNLVEAEEVELLAELAVVATLGLLETHEVGVEFLLREPRRAVDTLQHRAVRVTTPVGAGDLHELERADAAGIWHVRAATQVLERALLVYGDGLALGQLLDQLLLVRLALELVERFQAVELAALEREFLGDDLTHPLLDGLEVVGGERAFDIEVVVEAVLDRRPYAELGHREEVLHGLGHDVGRRVTEYVQRVRGLVGDDLDRIASAYDALNVDELAVELAGDRGLGEARSYRRGHVANACTLGHGLLAAVG